MDYNARIEETVSNILTLRQRGIQPIDQTDTVPERPKIKDTPVEPEEEEVVTN